MVAILTAHRRGARQWTDANYRLQALSVLDDFLMLRDEGSDSRLLQPSGKVPGENRFHWRTTLRHEGQAALIGACVVRVELFDPAFREGQMLASVEMLELATGPLATGTPSFFTNR
jgi:hypothetical protein